jgi:hypothetical protein
MTSVSAVIRPHSTSEYLRNEFKRHEIDENTEGFQAAALPRNQAVVGHCREIKNDSPERELA